MAKADGTKPDFEDRQDDLRAAMEQVEAANAEREAELEAKRASKVEASGAGKPADEGTPAEGEGQDTGTPAEGDKTGGDGKQGDKPADTEGQKQPEAAGAVEAPKNWSKADQETFKELPQKAQDFLLRRHKAMESDYTKKTAAVADLQRDFGPIQELFTPYQQQIRALGHTPYSMVQAWMNVEAALLDPARNAHTLRTIADRYGIDLGNGGGSAVPADAGKDELGAVLTPYLQPYQQEIAALKAQLGQFNNFQTETVQQRQMAAVQTVNNEINVFANSKNDKGELAHPYFNDVQDDMAMLIHGARAQGRPIPSLEEAYQMAVRANPSTYDRLVSAQQTAAASKAAEEARAKAARAKKAGSSISGAARGAQQLANGKDQGTIRSSLDAAFEDVMSR